MVLLSKDAMPSLVLSAEVASHLCRLVNAATQSARSLSHTPKAQPIEELCTRLEEILANFGRGLIEWQAGLPLEPNAKLALVELLSAVRELEVFQNNRGPGNT